MRKRQKLVLTALVLAILLLGTQLLVLDIRYIMIGTLGIVTWLLASWSLKDGLVGIEWLTVTLPSVLFTISVGLFYILLPQEWWARLLIALIFGVGQYALLLSANIFSVAAIRTIALFRAASAVSFVIVLVTAFFLYDTILSFRFPFYLAGLYTFITSFCLLLPAMWSVELLPKLNARIWSFSLYLALAMGFFSTAICFWPISTSVASLFLATMLYVVLGISQHHFADRLFNRTISEYVVVGLAVTITMLLTAGWGV